MALKTHWETIYQEKNSTQVSWYTPHLRLSLQMIERTGVDKAARIIDVGGGAATLVDDLLAHDYGDVTVLDISGAAIQVARERLGSLAAQVRWLEADVTEVALPPNHYDMWHDRAVFHFLTDARSRRAYVDTVRQAVKAGGHVIVATFAPDGPEKCSGLNVVRYDADSLHGEFGDDFQLMESVREDHQTPFGTQQKFMYCYCRR
jgi:ubiquinone/menaquinone biosynthesis C-methylase UbiE